MHRYTHQPVGILGFIGTEQRGQLLYIVTALRGNLVPDVPDFFKNCVFHQRDAAEAFRGDFDRGDGVAFTTGASTNRSPCFICSWRKC